ncbi:hypothetical protein RQP46_001431 [Phenoliferia psychrophenolica]
MKITFKTLQQKQFQIEAEPTETIGDLKKKIATDQGFAVETQKIIFSGKILADEKTVAEANFKEKDFCVVMVSKPKAAPAPAAPIASTSSAASEVPSTPMQPTPAAPVAPDAPGPAAVPAAAAADASTEAAAPAGPDDGSGFLVGSALQTSIDEMVSMGFPLDQVKRALRASYNNPHRAVDYLMNGIPANAEVPPPMAGPGPVPATPATPSPNAAAPPAPTLQGVPRNLFERAAAQANQPAAPAGGAAVAPGGVSELAALRDQPIFRQVRTLVQQNPALLQPFLAQLGQSNPEILALIDRNQAEFVAYLQEGTEGDDGDMGELMDQFGDGAGGAGGEAPDGSQYVQVTEEEKAAIERLVGMGFERNTVIQAFLACDRDEEMAANYLVEHGWGDGDDF